MEVREDSECWFYSCVIWILGIKFGLSDLAASAFTYRAILSFWYYILISFIGFYYIFFPVYPRLALNLG